MQLKTQLNQHYYRTNLSEFTNYTIQTHKQTYNTELNNGRALKHC